MINDTKNNQPGCAEYQSVSRRQFLSGGARTALASGLLLGGLPKVVLADNGPTRDVLLSIYLRGGIDGLTFCVPHGDSNYYALRPTIAIPQPSSSDPQKAINLDGFFGMPRPLNALYPAYQAGHLLYVHATGSTDPTRSHFDAQRYMEVGTPSDPTLYTGWLARHIATSVPVVSDSVLRAVGLDAGLPLTLTGAPATLPIPDPNYFGLEGRWDTKSTRLSSLKAVYGSARDPLKSTTLNTEKTIRLLDTIDFDGYTPAGGAVYSTDSWFAYRLKMAAALVKAQVGVEAIHIDFGGWDTHNNQQPLSGYMANLLTEFGNTLGAFYTDVFAAQNVNVTIVVLSEFGRNVAENASQGTDHGHGNAMMLIGKHITGGRVLTQWPGLSPAQQYEQQDLKVTIDHRDILAEVVQKRLGNTDLGAIFPNYTPTFRGVATL